MQSDQFRRAVAANEQNLCASRSCGRPRIGIEKWCKSCLSTGRLYGHPEARPLRPSLWAIERQQVQRLLDANADHLGLQSALAFLDGWSARATANDRAFKGAEEVARLARAGISSRDMLTEVAALSLWLHWDHHALPDQRACDFAMSRALFFLAPRPRRFVRGPGGHWPRDERMTSANSYSPKPRESALAYVGRHLREVLGPLLANVALSIEQHQQQEADRQAAMRAPLRPPQAA